MGLKTLLDRELGDAEAEKRFKETWSDITGPLALIQEINNIPIARRFIATGFSIFLVGGVLALLVRTQLVVPQNTFLDAESYNQVFTMHGTAMMFLFVIPFIEAIANYILPLQLGTRDLPFPRLTSLSYWTYLFGALFIGSSFLFGVAPNGGWFAYLPLTSKEFSPGLNIDFWDIGLSVAEVAAMGAAAEIMISILRMRAPGMSLNRMPIFAWAMLVTAFMIIFAFTPLIVGTTMLEFDRKGLTAFFKPEYGGEPLLWQHPVLGVRHPEVYIMFIPASGMVSHVVQTFSRRPLVGYPLVVLALLTTGFISFGLWVHHMYTTGLSPVALGYFAAASILIGIPAGIQVFSFVATIWTGRPVWKTPLLFAFGFLVTFVLGGLTGIMLGVVPFDWQAHDSYFVVAHFHYVLIGGVLFPLYAGLYYWIPKITGRMLNETIGKWNFWLMFIFFHITFFPMHIVGLLGMPRRIYTYPAGLGWEPYNLISTVGAFGFGAGATLILVNLLWSRMFGKEAGDNPYGSDTLEWSESSPPPDGQFMYVPVVRSRHPLWDQENLDPQDERTRRLLEPMKARPHGWRGALVVSVLDARPLAIVHVPKPTPWPWPFIMAVAFVLIFAGALLENLWVFLVGAVLTAGSLVGWFWPKDTEVQAIKEIPTEGAADRLPLAVAGPMANGYWGTGVFVLILATALATFVASYFYLGEGPDQGPPLVPHLGLPLVATGLIAGMGVSAWLFVRSIAREQVGLRRGAVTGGWLLGAGFVWLTLRSWMDSGLSPASSAYASAFVGLLSFQWVVMTILLVMIGIAVAWAWRSPSDVRGHATTWNASLLGYFSVVSWLTILVTLYLTPRLW